MFLLKLSAKPCSVGAVHRGKGETEQIIYTQPRNIYIQSHHPTNLSFEKIFIKFKKIGTTHVP